MIRKYANKVSNYPRTNWIRLKEKTKNLHSTLVIFGIVFIFALLRCQIAFKMGQYGVTTEMNFQQARNVLGGLDAGSYLAGGLSFQDNSFRLAENNFIWQLWPPGMPIFWFVMSKIFGADSSPLLISAVMSSALLATWVASLWFFSIKSRFKIFSRIILVFILLSSLTQGWLLDQGIMYAEGFYIFFTVLALIIIANNPILNTKLLISVGALIGIAAYFRAVGFTVIIFLIFLSLIAAVIGFIGYFLKLKTINKLQLSGKSKSLGIITMTAYLTTLPWVFFRETWLSTGLTKWVITGDKVWQGVWATDKQLKDSGWGITTGVDNWACHIDKLRCQEIQKNTFTDKQYFLETLKTIFTNPLDFINLRANDLWHYWELNGRWLYPPQNKIPAAYGTLEGLTYLLIFGAAMILLLRSFGKLTVLVFVELGIILGSTAPLIVFHLESRYFIPVKIVTACILILNGMPLLNRYQSNEYNEKP